MSSALDEIDALSKLMMPAPVIVKKEVNVVEGNPGDRLFLKTEKLNLLIQIFEALNDAAHTHEPRMLACSPEGLSITFGVQIEGRVHNLFLPAMFFTEYRVQTKGFRTIFKLSTFIENLQNIPATAEGRCVQIYDNPDGTLEIEGILKSKIARGTLLTMGGESSLPECKRISEKAYHRFQIMLMIPTPWIHGVFKRLEKQTEVTIEFDMETRYLKFVTTVDGATREQGEKIPPSHILRNPFLLPQNNKQVLFFADGNPAFPALTSAPSFQRESKELFKESKELFKESKESKEPKDNRFYYKATFVPHSICLSVKRPKLSSHVNMYLEPVSEDGKQQPLLLQYLFQQSTEDSRVAATYDTWIKPISKIRNPSIHPSIRAETVAQKMLEVAKEASTSESTYKLAENVIESLTQPTLLKPLKPITVAAKLKGKVGRPPNTFKKRKLI